MRTGTRSTRRPTYADEGKHRCRRGRSRLPPRQQGTLARALRQRQKLDKRLHSVLTDTKIGEVDGTGCELLLPLGFGWHMDELEKALPTLQQIAERKSGIAGFQVRLRYDGQ